jgi:hypothetical protein
MDPHSFWNWLIVLAIVVALWIFRDKLPGGGGPSDSGPDPAPADFAGRRRKRIIDRWQRWS